jgi:hypothetical protein
MHKQGILNPESSPIDVWAEFRGRRSRLSRAVSTARLFLSVRFWMCRIPLPFQLAREFRNFLYRIRATLQSKLYRRGVSMGQPHRTCEGLTCLICAETRGRTSDMQRLCIQRPYLTSLDWEIFLTGWQRGSEFQTRIHKLQLSKNMTLTYSSVVPQSSKRDRSIPPPSQE